MNTSPTRSFVLCADDFALSPAVSRGILRLLEAGRLTATGAMTNRPSWREGARELVAFASRADLGLHLNLTCGRALTGPSRLAPGGNLPRLPALAAGALSGRLPIAALEAEIAAQLDAFAQGAGREPDFLDGHQHVHALPGVRRALANVLLRRYPREKPWLRAPAYRLASIRARRFEARKATLVAGLARGFGRAMAGHGFPLNRGFSGFSDFDAEADFAEAFRTYLIAPGPAPLVMCHPGEVDDELASSDPVVATRPKELAFFLSDRFEETCRAAGLTLARFRDL